ncbi:hypothetical protein DFP72DRAFT_1041083 [Ephemerocybe angulata]|uniref:HMG box domain-containing protein n=1 Tax=Ephemerocybe angulata TaxID=980116 RepID=A0A8H6IBG5_9AGAR|nr:hypothetical protein DFP72DRAFT_1041083 [Tulosesus angulatus]
MHTTYRKYRARAKRCFNWYKYPFYLLPALTPQILFTGRCQPRPIMPAERTRKVPSRASHPLASTPGIRSTASNAVFGHTAPGVLDLHALQVTDKPSLFDLSSLDSPDTIGLPEGRKRNGDMKKPPNHFIVFRALATRKLSKERAGKLVMGISTAVSTIWNCLTEAEKQPFIRRAGELKNLHERECAFKRDVKQVEDCPSSTSDNGHTRTLVRYIFLLESC